MLQKRESVSSKLIRRRSGLDSSLHRPSCRRSESLPILMNKAGVLELIRNGEDSLVEFKRLTKSRTTTWPGQDRAANRAVALLGARSGAWL